MINVNQCFFSNKKNIKATLFNIENEELKIIAKKVHLPENSDLSKYKDHNVRFLGNFFNCTGSFKEMINIIINKNNSNFGMVMRAAATYKLNSIAIWRLGSPVIVSLIEFGMKFYTAESEKEVKKVFVFQYHLARYALVARGSTNLEKLEKLLNFEGMELIVMKRLLEFEEQAVVAPESSLKSSSMQQFLDYKNKLERENYQKKLINPRCKIKQFEELATMKKSVFMRARLIRRKYGLVVFNEMENIYFNEEKKPMPAYIESYPRNLVIMEDFEVAIKLFKNKNSSIWWTDGSCEDNIGAYGAVTLQERANGRLTSFYGYINHQTEINYCEHAGIEAVLKEITKDEEIINNNEIENIVIFTDSMAVIKMFQPNGYPSTEQYYNIMMRTFKLINNLNNFKKVITLVKVAAHIGHTGNELADWWAKYGYYKVKLEDENLENGDFNENIVPLSVRNEWNNKWLEKEYKWEKRQKRKEKIKRATQLGKKRIKSKIMRKIKKCKHFVKEMALMSRSETGVITRLRTEHIDLNVYNNIIFAKGTQTSMNCNECKRYETVRHYLLDCKKYKQQRKDLIEELKDISDEFVIRKNQNVRRILFNFKYQEKPYELENIEIRVKILKAVCKYVAKTERFINERIKTKIFVNIDKKYNKKEEMEENSDDEDRNEEIINSNIQSIDELNVQLGNDAIHFQSYT